MLTIGTAAAATTWGGTACLRSTAAVALVIFRWGVCLAVFALGEVDALDGGVTFLSGFSEIV